MEKTSLEAKKKGIMTETAIEICSISYVQREGISMQLGILSFTGMLSIAKLATAMPSSMFSRL
jgi:hypothetical protein